MKKTIYNGIIFFNELIGLDLKKYLWSIGSLVFNVVYKINIKKKLTIYGLNLW